MLQVQRASAGSGKTEQLARQYLQIFLKSEHTTLDPAAVVATTFTREAAGEIVARIFRLTARACEDEAFRFSLVSGTELSTPTQQDCSCLLRHFVDNIDRLSIGTIDGLFAQQARVLALDLGMTSPWEIADSLTSEELSRETLLQLIGKKREVREAWSLLHHGTRTLSFVEKGTSLFEKNRWIVRVHPRDKEHLRPGPPKRFDDAERVQKFLETFEIPLNSKGKPDPRWTKALHQLKGFFSRPLLLKDLLEGGSLLRNCLNAGPILRQVGSTLIHDCVYELTSADPLPTFYKTPIPTHFVDFFLPFLLASIEEQRRLESLREWALWEIMESYEVLRQEISFRAGKYTFTEVEEAVQAEHHQLSLDEIELRMDLRMEHLLLDEYQDTSQRQHDFLSPLIGNILAKGGEVFVVGDLKQGIYGWRGGKRHLLNLLEQEYAVFKKEISPLNQSYRSSRAVMEAVNKVFEALKKQEKLLAMGGGSSFEKAAARWSNDFQPHVGAPSVSDLQGRVRTHSIPENDDPTEDPMSGLFKKAVTLVEEHLAEDPLREVAILVRRTKFISPLLQHLREKDIVASGEGGNPLADTLAVELILSLLTWIDHPGHTAAYHHIFHSPLRELIDQKDAALRLRQQLLDGGIATTLRSWIRRSAFQDACSAYEHGRLEQLIGLVEKWSATSSGSLSSIVKRIRRERIETPLPANVRVLTFHAAKGLEFEAVILMDLDVDITAGGERGLRVQQDEEGGFFIQSNQETMTFQGRSSLLAALQEEQWAEMLSLLYVGMTRAASYLDLIFFEKPTRKKTMAQWLRVCGLEQHEVKGKSLRLLKPRSPVQPPKIPLQRPSITPYQKFSQRHPSEDQEGDLISLRQVLQGRAARERGIALHAELAEIEWGEEKEILQQESFLEKWKIKGVTQLELWRERRFAVVKEKELISGIFDRVVIGKNEKSIPIVAEIIDFKTGKTQQAELEWFYQPQLKAYQQALQIMLPSLDEITTRLVWVKEIFQ